MPNGITLGIDLTFIEMPLSVPFACKIVLVSSPGNTCHEIHLVAALFPRGDAVFDGRFTLVFVGWITPDAVNHHGISPVINFRHPGPGGLESGLGVICSLDGSCT